MMLMFILMSIKHLCVDIFVANNILCKNIIIRIDLFQKIKKDNFFSQK